MLAPAPAPTSEPETILVPLSHRISPAALGAVFRLTVARQLRGRRLWAFALLFAIPVAIAVLARQYDDRFREGLTESLLIFGLIPQALLPLTALLFASGMIQDEIDEQTLTYLLVRPIPRWLIDLVKVAATWLVTLALTAVFTTLTFVAIHWGQDDLFGQVLAVRAPITVAVMGLGLFAYVPIFGVLSLLVRRPLVVGVIYVAVLEGLVANVDFVIRQATVMYAMRVLWIRWLALREAEWSINLDQAPSATSCIAILLLSGAISAAIGAWLFARNEFRVKTPEGNGA
jgi:ABC-2 type transport system permease protein